ncbi:MAG: hypothetical protein EXR98_06355 [Gemmataceae bacterium]|nr:hypothetical protein [Gemmataceae bacterium]
MSEPEAIATGGTQLKEEPFGDGHYPPIKPFGDGGYPSIKLRNNTSAALLAVDISDKIVKKT